MDGGGGDGVSETEFFGFGDALVGAEGGADFATETDFAKNNVGFVELAASYGGGDSHTNG